MSKTNLVRADKDVITSKGYNPPAPDPFAMYHYEDTRVPHEDIDNDDQRKQTNRERHSSYRK